ncbi:Protein of unknown function [Lactobacillus helveticus CIRM-BIA 101]|uniref:Uncharacterized protein n=1 Tax=Lactobacillus helveticus CIRM-BIA 104 TaxID=1226333 RepID=U6FC86_LACHE|nr:Protein of unknown function [Lactobacillus helveticus CIRM-BIA 104]CDI64447.1 Protein of unknown function [Lactobacillus helveticus CIRM-BIA 101]
MKKKIILSSLALAGLGWLAVSDYLTTSLNMR